jgi:hypothetical protein
MRSFLFLTLLFVLVIHIEAKLHLILALRGRHTRSSWHHSHPYPLIKQSRVAHLLIFLSKLFQPADLVGVHEVVIGGAVQHCRAVLQSEGEAFVEGQL